MLRTFSEVRFLCAFWEVAGIPEGSQRATWSGLSGAEIQHGGGGVIGAQYSCDALREISPRPPAVVGEARRILLRRFPAFESRLTPGNVEAWLYQMQGLEAGHQLLIDYYGQSGWRPDVVITLRSDVLLGGSLGSDDPASHAQVRVARIHPRFPDGVVVYPWELVGALVTSHRTLDILGALEDPSPENFRLTALRQYAPHAEIRSVPLFYEIYRGGSAWRWRTRLLARRALRRYEGARGAVYPPTHVGHVG